MELLYDMIKSTVFKQTRDNVSDQREVLTALTVIDCRGEKD